MQYQVLKFLHILGVILLIGNVTITAFWKVFADRSNDPLVIAQAQRIVILADWFFTLAGILLILGGGYGMLLVAGTKSARRRVAAVGAGTVRDLGRDLGRESLSPHRSVRRASRER